MIPAQFELQLPPWLLDEVVRRPTSPMTLLERMAWVIRLSAENVRQGTGGPFAAAVFDEASGELVAAGVNLVLSSRLSMAHAEVVTLALAQRAADSFSLADRPWVLLSSAEPCSMCTGAIHWSGIRSLVFGARGDDVRDTGFDEGDKPDDWIDRLTRRGIRVEPDVHRELAARTLQDYRTSGGPIY